MKKNWKKLIIAALCVLMITVFFATSVTAKSKAPRNGKYIDKAGHVYIMKHGKPRTGYFKYHGKYYYGHKTSSRKYPKGSVTQGQFRIKSPGKWYAYDVNGAQIRKDYYVRKGHKKLIKKVAPLVPYVRVYLVLDKEHRLDYKDSPTDKGKDILLQLMKEKILVTMEDVNEVIKRKD